MTDEDIDENITVNADLILEYSSNINIIRFIQTKFKRLYKSGAINLIREILNNNVEISISDITKKNSIFLKYNKKRFDSNGILLEEVLLPLIEDLHNLLIKLGKDLPYNSDDKDLKKIDNMTCLMLNAYTTYKKIRKIICDEGGDVVFRYNFEEPDLGLSVPDNTDTLQRCQIQILSNSIKFDYPIEFEYKCPQCDHAFTKLAYQTVCTNNKIGCPGIYQYMTSDGEPRVKICGLSLSPDNEISLTKNTYYYDISYEDSEGNKHTVGAISFEKYKPGFFECALFKIKNPKKTELFHVMDIKPMDENILELPEQTEENYLFTLVKKFDEYIKEKTGMDIYGLYPMKVALIIQALTNMLGFKLINNVQIVGDASTGKSTVLKYYGNLLYNHLNLSTNGLSISIPALRGTKDSITLMGKDQRIVTMGHLGTFKGIHIDEAGENRELIQNLKTFLLEDNYGYDKAGGTGVFNKRTCQMNISENLDYAHLGQYRGAIRKAYKDEAFQIKGETKDPWNENWDLHLPIFKYTNPYLYKIIKEKRTEFQLRQVFWIDGYDFALHERFPFYFYLVINKKDIKLLEVIKENVSRNTISENLELMRALKTSSIETFFKSLKDIGVNDIEGFGKVDIILDQYDVHADSRTKSFFYNLLKISRIINGRADVKEMDYDLLKWFIEKMNCKLDVADTADYKIYGAPDIEEQQQKAIEIEENTIDSSVFGLPEGGFE